MIKNNDDSTYSASKATSSSTKNLPPKSGQKKLRELIAERRSKTLETLSKNKIEVDVMDPYEAVNNYKNFEEKKTVFIEQESISHYCLWDENYPENPERVTCARRRLEALGLIKRCDVIKSEVYSDDIFLKLHSKELYERLQKNVYLSDVQLREESSRWDSVYLTQDTFRDAKLSAEAALTMVLKVAKGDYKNGFALIRPPGHHAMVNAFCGYCFINNVAVAAETAIAEGFAKKILIVDYDVHHGQGTQQMFYNRNDVLYFSIHRFEHGEFWPHLRESDFDYIGEGQGKGFNVNVPLNKIGLGDSDYLGIVLNLLLPMAYEFNPDLILISAGYDAAVGCPEGQMNVSPHFYGHLITLLSGLANGKIAVCLEGGYFKESLAEGIACTLKALLGDVCYPLNIHSNPTVDPALEEVINSIKFFLHDYWECFKCEPLFEYPKPGPVEKSLEYNEDDEHVACLDFKHIATESTVFETSNCYPVRNDEEREYFSSIIGQLREAYSKGRIYNDVVGYIYDDELLKHKPTNDSGKTPPEKPERLIEIMKHFEEFNLKDRCKKINEYHLDETLWLEKTHSSEYIKSILTLEGLLEKPDWYYNNYTSSCIKKCISSILSLAQNISEGIIRAGVGLIRPPGHHASFNKGSGFCFVNNVVIAAEYLIQKELYERVLIVDFDIHHGNGTQELTYNRSDIMYLSVHRFDGSKFFPSLPEGDFKYIGQDAGVGFNINIPFNKGSKTDSDYWTIWHKLVLPIAYSYNPDFVIISAGFDAGIYDPLGGGYKVTPEMFGHLVQTLKPLASGRILLALEGGYHTETTALSMTMCIKALLGDPLPVPNFYKKVSEDTLETVKNVVLIHRRKWPLLKVNKKLANFCYTQQQKQKLENLLKSITVFEAKQQFEKIIEQCKGRIK